MATTDQTPTMLGPTAQLSSWVSNVTLNDIPEDIVTRAKYLILDGIGCGLVGAHLLWSEKAAKAILSLEPAGDATVIGWERKLPPLSAALLNSSFVQGFELDDWHSDAPLHSNAILLPALLAAGQHVSIKLGRPVTGPEFLLANIVGFEVGPRVGLGLYGTHILSTGWHSGAVFGPSASAAAVAKLLDLDADQIEDALGIACTQACGLMSAQYGSEVKRIQHGFAARNGLLAAFLAKGGYTGIRGVYEQDYGGFLKQFSLGNGKDPQYRPEEVAKGLGSTWRTNGVRVKPYAAMAGTHSTIDCIRGLQQQHPEKLSALTDIKRIRIQLAEAAFHHGGWKATRPLTSTGAQMSNSYVAATQLIDRQVLPTQFRHNMLERNDIWRLVDNTDCELSAPPDAPAGRQTVTIEFVDGWTVSQTVNSARGVEPPLSNKEIVQKFRELTAQVIDRDRATRIEETVMAMHKLDDLSPLYDLLSGFTRNPIA